MNVTVPIPDDFAARFGPGVDVGRRALEALVLEEYRAGRTTRPEIQRLLGFADESELASFLAIRSIDVVEVPGDPQPRQPLTESNIVEQFIAFGARNSLAGLDVVELIREGRR